MVNFTVNYISIFKKIVPSYVSSLFLLTLLGLQSMRQQFWVHAPAPDSQTLPQVGQHKV